MVAEASGGARDGISFRGKVSKRAAQRGEEKNSRRANERQIPNYNGVNLARPPLPFSPQDLVGISSSQGPRLYMRKFAIDCYVTRAPSAKFVDFMLSNSPEQRFSEIDEIERDARAVANKSVRVLSQTALLSQISMCRICWHRWTSNALT